MPLCNDCDYHAEISECVASDLLLCSKKKGIIRVRENCSEYKGINGSVTKNEILVFIGSSASTRSKNIAECVHLSLQDKGIKGKIWCDVFQPTNATLPGLENILSDCNAGIFVFEPEDMLKLHTGEGKYSEEVPVVRDNVLLEFGMFLGRYGSKKTFIIVPKDKLAVFHRPSDLEGITFVPYGPIEKDTDIMQNIRPIVGQQIALRLLKVFEEAL